MFPKTKLPKIFRNTTFPTFGTALDSRLFAVDSRLLLRVGNTNMAAIYSNGGNRWNILGFNFTKRDVLSSLYKISMLIYHVKYNSS
jgi:hypothetical protein